MRSVVKYVRNRVFLVKLAVLLVLLQITDCIATIYLTTRGVAELNPFIRGVIGTPVYPILKIGWLLLFIGVFLWMDRKYHQFVLGTFYFFVSAAAFVAIYQLLNLIVFCLF